MLLRFGGTGQHNVIKPVARIGTLPVLPTSCETLGKILHISEPQFTHL